MEFCKIAKTLVILYNEIFKEAHCRQESTDRLQVLLAFMTTLAVFTDIIQVKTFSS